MRCEVDRYNVIPTGYRGYQLLGTCNTLYKTNWYKCKISDRLCNSKCQNSGVCSNKLNKICKIMLSLYSMAYALNIIF